MKKNKKKFQLITYLAALAIIPSMALPFGNPIAKAIPKIEKKNQSYAADQNGWQNAIAGEKRTVQIASENDLKLEQALKINYLQIAKRLIFPKGNPLIPNSERYGTSRWEYDLAEIVRSNYGTFFDVDGNVISNAFDSGRKDVYVPIAARTMPSTRVKRQNIPTRNFDEYDKNSLTNYERIRPQINFKEAENPKTTVEYSFDHQGRIQSISFIKDISFEEENPTVSVMMARVPTAQGNWFNSDEIYNGLKSDFHELTKEKLPITRGSNNVYILNPNMMDKWTFSKGYKYKEFNLGKAALGHNLGVKVTYSFAQFLDAKKSEEEARTSKYSSTPYVSASLVDPTSHRDYATNYKSPDFEQYSNNPFQYIQFAGRMAEFGRSIKMDWLNVLANETEYTGHPIWHVKWGQSGWADYYWEMEQYAEMNDRYLNREIMATGSPLFIANPGDVLNSDDQYDFVPWEFFDKTWKPIAMNLESKYPEFSDRVNFDRIKYDMEVDLGKTEESRIKTVSNEKFEHNRLGYFSWLYSDVYLGSKQDSTYSSTFDANGKIIRLDAFQTIDLTEKQASAHEAYPSYTSVKYDETGNVKDFYTSIFKEDKITYATTQPLKRPPLYNIWTALFGQEPGRHIDDYIGSINNVLGLSKNFVPKFS